MAQSFLKISFIGLASALTLSACAAKPKPGLGADKAVAVSPNDQRAPAAPSLDGVAAPPSLQEDLAAKAGDRVFFALDSYLLDGQAKDSLAAQARWLMDNPRVRVMVAGNCDERGTREYNLALGARRASAARDFLVAQGVSPGRIVTMSYGKERPIATGSDDAAWSRNRNAATVIIDLAPG